MSIKVLLSAYACEPGRGSEPSVGWNWVRQIGRFAEVWVITRASNRAAIEKALAEESVPNVHWVYFDLPAWARFWKRGQRGIHLYYYLWQIGAYRIGRRLTAKLGFDLVHHVTFVNYWLPSFLSLLPVPFVWGPVGGGESAPKNFYENFSGRGRLYEKARNLARRLGEHDPFVRMTAKESRFAFATSDETAERLKNLGAPNIKVLSQVALPAKGIQWLASVPAHTGNPYRLLSLGRLLHWKGFHLGLQAFARYVRHFPRSEYWIVGDGPERKNLERLARDFAVAEKVRFWGALPRAEALEKMTDCDVLVHPSLHDSGGWACVEAMAAGRPVICLDLGGPALQVTEETGFKIPAQTPEQAVGEIAQAMLKLAIDPGLRRRMGEAARCRVREVFSWERRGAEICELYGFLLGYRS